MLERKTKASFSDIKKLGIKKKASFSDIKKLEIKTKAVSQI